MVLVSGFWMAGHFDDRVIVSSEAQAVEDGQAAMHISDRVRIVRPETPAEDPVAPPVVPDDVEPPVDPLVEDPVVAEEAVADDDLVDVLMVDDTLGEVLVAIAPEDRYYDETGRVDPFEPFLRRPEPEAEVTDETEIRRIPRTPLERIALGQLKLTAVIMADERELVMAMVEDPRGRGYVIREGTYIGEDGGIVSRILPSKVIVEEPHRDVFGKTTIRERELQIQRQAGE